MCVNDLYYMCVYLRVFYLFNILDRFGREPKREFYIIHFYIYLCTFKLYYCWAKWIVNFYIISYLWSVSPIYYNVICILLHYIAVNHM